MGIAGKGACGAGHYAHNDSGHSILKENETSDFFPYGKNDRLGISNADISAGGIKFIPDEYIFNIDDTIELKFLSEEFGKDINANARIINSIGDKLIAKYSDISEFDRDKIAGFCLKVLSERS